MENKETTVVKSLRITEDVKGKLEAFIGTQENNNIAITKLLEVFQNAKREESKKVGFALTEEKNQLNVALDTIKKVAEAMEDKVKIYTTNIELDVAAERRELDNIATGIEEKTEEAIAEILSRVEEKETENKGLLETIKELEAAAELNTETNNNLRIEIEEYRNKVSKLELSEKHKKITVEKAEKEVIKVLAENNKIMEENKELILKIKSLEMSVEELDSITRERDRLVIELDVKTKENLRFEAEIEAKENKIDSLNKDVMENAINFKNESKELQDKLDRISEEKHKLELELAVLKAKEIKY